MVTKRGNPRNAQLGDRDALTIRYGRQSVDELEILSYILEPAATPGMNSGAQDVKSTDIILETAERLKSPSSKSSRLLKMTGE